MEFAWNTKKNKISDIKGLEKEQDREGKISNKEIDPNKTHLNYELVPGDLKLYQRVKNRVDEVRPVSRIQKNSVVDYSNIITVPQEQFKEWGLERSKEYLKETYNYFCKELGTENIVSAKVHLDETTPHMHLHFVPVSEQGKLQARTVMIPQRINKIHTEAPQYLQEKGFDIVRGVGKTKTSLEINEFKAEKLKEEIKGLESKLNTLKNDFEAVRGVSSSIRELDCLEVKKGFLGGKVTLSEKDYNKLLDMSKQGVHNSSKVKNLEFENNNLKDDNKIYKDSTQKTMQKVVELKKENQKLESRVKSLTQQAKVIFNTLEKHDLVPEAKKVYANMKEAEKVSENILKKNHVKEMDFER